MNEETSVVIVNGSEEIVRKLFNFMAKQGYRAPENYEVTPDKTKIVVFTK